MGVDYFNFAEIYTAFERLATDHSEHVELLSLSELSHEGRSVRALRLAEDVSSSETKPVFMIVGGLHGCEWGSTEILVNLAADLVQGRDNGLDFGGKTFDKDEVKSVLQKLDLLLLPLANPDGGFHSRTEFNDWRKNRSREQAGSGPGIGVDLNRNFDQPLAESIQPAVSSQYPGPAPFSEPESRNIRKLVEDLEPDWFVDLHSGARGVVYPWSVAQPVAPVPTSDEAEHQALGAVYAAAAAAAASGQPMPVSAGFQFSSASGTSHDWVYGRARPPSADATGAAVQRQSTRAFCIEWSSSAVPTWFDMQRRVRETCAGLIAMCLDVQVG